MWRQAKRNFERHVKMGRDPLEDLERFPILDLHELTPREQFRELVIEARPSNKSFLSRAYFAIGKGLEIYHSLPGRPAAPPWLEAGSWGAGVVPQPDGRDAARQGRAGAVPGAHPSAQSSSAGAGAAPSPQPAAMRSLSQQFSDAVSWVGNAVDGLWHGLPSLSFPPRSVFADGAAIPGRYRAPVDALADAAASEPSSHVDPDAQLGRARRSAPSPSPASPAPAPAPARGAATAAPSGGNADADAAYVRGLRRSLRDWVDYDKARKLSDRPYRLLKAVAHHYRQPIPEAFETTLDGSQLQDEGLLDEAALLYHQLRHGEANEAPGGRRALTSDELRSRFLQTLLAENEQHRALAQLLVNPAAPGGPYFDGFAIRNAFGKSFDDLLQWPGLSTDPAFASLSVEQRRALLNAKFDELGESTQYPIGTSQHSMASAVIAVANYRGEPVPTAFPTEEALFKAYHDIEVAWSNDRSIYPINPRLLLALHLVRSSGVEVINVDQLANKAVAVRRLEEEKATRREAAATVSMQPGQDGNDVPNFWSDRFLAGFNGDGLAWHRRGDAVIKEAVMSMLDALRDAAAKDEPVPAFESEMIQAGSQQVWGGGLHALAVAAKQAGLLAEVVVGKDWREKTSAVLDYASERLLATFGTPPSFDREEAARRILKQYGMNETTIAQPREYVMLVGMPPLPMARTGTPVEEFLARIDAPLAIDASMEVGSSLISPQIELQQDEEAFNSGREWDPWVRAKSAENRRLQGKFVTPSSVDQEAQRIGANYQAETENHRTGVRIFKTLVNLTPVVGSIYNIVEGARNRDVEQTVVGAFSLGVEAGGAAPAGRGVSMKTVPPRQRPALADFHYVTTSLDIPTVRLADHAPGRATIGDAAQIGLRDGNVPAAQRSLATRVRNGEWGVKWQGYEVVLLANEDRVVPVKHAGGAYQEIDWHTGHRARHARLIHRDAASRTYRSDVGLKGGGRGAGPVDSDGTPVKDRLTPAAVTRMLSLATDGTVRNFERMFEDCFSVRESQPNALEGWDVKGYFSTLYERSHTFRRLFNRYYDTTPSGERLWRLNFGGRPETGRSPTSPVKPATFELSKNMDFPVNRDLDADEFMSASGKSRYNKEHVVLHETIHALTGLKDPTKPDRTVNAQAEAKFDRGPVVYLTDKILSEAGFDFDERVTYFDMQEGANDSRLKGAVSAAHAENLYLDPIVDRGRPLVTSATVLEGVSVADRITVKQWKEFEPKLEGVESPSRASGRRKSHDEKLLERFELCPLENDGRDISGPTLNKVERLVGRFLVKSRTFRALVDNLREMPRTGEGQWKFEFDPQVAASELPFGQVVDGVSDLHKKIYLVEDGSSYLTEMGLKSMEFERRVAHSLVYAMTNLKVPENLAYGNRGAAVRIVDDILNEAGFHQPKQLVAARASADEASKATLLSHLTSARRSTAVEDAYLGQRSRRRPPLSPEPLDSRKRRTVTSQSYARFL